MNGEIPSRAVDDNGAAVDLVKAQYQVEDRRFAAARGADQRGDVSRLGDEGQASDHLLAGTVRELHVCEFHPCLRKLERRLVFLGGFRGRMVDDVEQDAHSHQSAIEVEIEAGKAFGRLVSEHEGREKREELTRGCSGLDHPEAAVNQRAGDREPAEGLHQRTRAVGHPRPLVRLVFEFGNAGVEALAHGIFERKRLDDTHALQRLL